MKIDVEQFQESLPSCEDYLLRSYINCAQAELDLRAQRELENAKTALKHCSQPQLFSLLAELGIELPVATTPKKRVRKNPLPYGWQPYVWQDQQYHVPPFFNVELQQPAVGAQTGWLQGLSPEARREQYGTTHLLSTGQLQWAALVKLGLVRRLMEGEAQIVSLDELGDVVDVATTEVTTAEPTVEPSTSSRRKKHSSTQEPAQETTQEPA